MKKTIVIYHADCPDGFGGAWAAWRVLGEEAEYRSAKHGNPPPEGLAGRDVILIDFSYPLEQLQKIESEANSLVILDHHEGAREAVESVKQHIYDQTHSGAFIAWNYFHPEEPLPKLLSYVEDNDLWKFQLPFAKAITAYLSTIPFDFEKWSAIAGQFEDENHFKSLVERGSNYSEHLDSIIEILSRNAELVDFEGWKVYAVNAPRLFRSELGNSLARKQGPFAIVWYYAAGKWHFSMRGTGEVDLSDVAKKYGGNGHANSASFRLPMEQPFPFKKAE